MNKVLLHTVTPGGPVGVAPRHVVVVPPESDLAAGFDVARTLLETHPAVRIVGDGVTRDAVWPAWAKEAPRLVLTELGAYGTRLRAEAGAPLTAAWRAYLKPIFAGVVPGTSGEQVFFTGAASRIFQPVLDTMVYARALAEEHPGATFVCVDPTWIGLEALVREVEATGGRIAPAPSGRASRRGATASRARWSATLLGAGVGGIALSIVHQGKRFWRERRGREALDALRKNRHAAPRVWLGLLPDWYRMNRPVLEAVRSLIASGEPVGILLCLNLAPGGRSESDLLKREGDELWPGLGDLARDLERHAIDQIAGPESLPELARNVTSSAAWSAVVVGRMLARGPHAGGGAFALDTHALALAKLATIDVFRARGAADAADRACRRYSFEGATVIFSASDLPEMIAADLRLQRAGATSVELTHGWFGEAWPGVSESRSTVRCVWTRQDGIGMDTLGRPFVVAGAPPQTLRVRTPRRAPKYRVLVLTNYVHRDSRVAGRLTREWLQDELADGLREVLRRFGARLEVTWRPHPADLDEAIARGAARIGEGVTISRGRSLADDLDACDLIVASLSSATIESLFTGVPVLVHVPPDAQGLPRVDFVDPSRAFFRPVELATRIERCIAALDAETPDFMGPEERARAILWGEAAQPEPLAPLLEGLRRLR